MADLRDLQAKRQIVKHNKKWAEFDVVKLAIVQDFGSYDDVLGYLAAIAANLVL
jgi:hypothetical protein